MRYPLVADSWGVEERSAILQVLDSGQLTSGPRVREFEREFARYVGARYAVAVNSGSSANLIAVAALSYCSSSPLQPGDEAIVPAVAWATTYAPLQQHGLRLRIVDVDLETLNMDPQHLEATLTKRTRLLVGVSILGNPADLSRMRAFADRHGLWFLEDNCESLGAMLYGKCTGTFGHLGTYSLFFSHHLNTVEGGVIVTNDEELYQLALCLREHGWTRALKPDGGFYDFVLPGYNVRPTEFLGAVGLIQLVKLNPQLIIRRKNARLFRTLFATDERFVLQRENGSSSWFAFTMIAQSTRSQFLERMSAAGIEHRMVTGGCFTLHPAARYYDFQTVGSLANAEQVHRNGFFVGNAGRDLSEELQYLKEVLK